MDFQHLVRRLGRRAAASYGVGACREVPGGFLAQNMASADIGVSILELTLRAYWMNKAVDEIGNELDNRVSGAAHSMAGLSPVNQRGQVTRAGVFQHPARRPVNPALNGLSPKP